MSKPSFSKRLNIWNALYRRCDTTVLDTTVERREAQTRTVDNVEQLRTLPKGVMRAAVKVDGVDGEVRYFERHVNRNGDLGGFVEDTAYAGKDTYVGAKALVLEKARMTDHSMIYGTTTSCSPS